MAGTIHAKNAQLTHQPAECAAHGEQRAMSLVQQDQSKPCRYWQNTVSS